MRYGSQSFPPSDASSSGVLLAHDMLAYDDLRTGRLVIPVPLALRSGRAYHFVCKKNQQKHTHVQGFRVWLKQEVTALDWRKIEGRRSRLTRIAITQHPGEAR